MSRLNAALVSLAILCAPAAYAADCIVPPAAGHASLKALPDGYWRGIDVWADLPAPDRDLLARVAIAQRNLRTNGEFGPFNASVPRKMANVPGFSGKSFVPKGAPQLAKMATDLRAYLKVIDPESMFDMGDTFRSYEVQLANWPANLRRYFKEYRGQLTTLSEDGRYSDDDVCNFRKYAANRFAFPGYSRHQAGNAVDFKTRAGRDGPELNASTSLKKIGKTGMTNTRLWCTSPAYQWLTANARRYGFVQARIDEPWHWEYEPKEAADPERANYIAPTCRVVEAEAEQAPEPSKKKRRVKRERRS